MDRHHRRISDRLGVGVSRDGNALLILLGGGVKKGQRAGIRKAESLFAEYKSRKGAAKLEQKRGATRDFKQTVAERVQRDPAFAKALLDEAATLFLNGEPDTARLILRDLVNATVGFEELATETSKPAKSLHRMLSAKGNPSMDNLAGGRGGLLGYPRSHVEIEHARDLARCAFSP